MLTPDWLQDRAGEIEDLYDRLGMSISQDMARRIARMEWVSESSVWQARVLQEAGGVFEDALRIIAEASGQTEEELARLFIEAGSETLRYDDSVYRAVGLDPIPVNQSPALLQTLNATLLKTGQQMNNLTLTTATASQSAFIEALNLVHMQVSSGAMSYTQAIVYAVRDIADQGSWVFYPTGHRDRLDVAMRRAALAGVNQSSGYLQVIRANEMGCDIMELTAHYDARPSHAEWQGQLVSLSGQPGYLTLDEIGYETGDGFMGWGCRHGWAPYFVGYSDRMYTGPELEAMKNRTVTVGGEKIPGFDATQMQRSMERGIRATKRELVDFYSGWKAATDPAMQIAMKGEFDAAAVSLKEQEAALESFRREAGFLRQREREQVLGFGRNVSSQAVWSTR